MDLVGGSYLDPLCTGNCGWGKETLYPALFLGWSVFIALPDAGSGFHIKNRRCNAQRKHGWERWEEVCKLNSQELNLSW